MSFVSRISYVKIGVGGLPVIFEWLATFSFMRLFYLCFFSTTLVLIFNLNYYLSTFIEYVQMRVTKIVFSNNIFRLTINI